VWGLGGRVWGSRFRVLGYGAGFRVKGLENRVWGLGFRIQCSWSGVWCLVFGVWG